MVDYKNYLAAKILTEDKVVTYRILSRALKVHVNTAKEMLYGFHRQQNAKKPGTIHATYLLSGTKTEEQAAPTNGTKDGEDENMQMSPFMSSPMPLPEDTGSSSTMTITLVREEDLDSVKAQYETITSIHIYSLGPHPLKDIQLLSDSTRELQVLTATEDPLETAPTYGIITNPLCKQRPNRRPPSPIVPTATPAPVKKAPEAVKVKEELPKSSKVSTQSAAAKDFFGKGKEKAKAATRSGSSSKEGTPAPPANLKRENSSLFKSFAKAMPKKLAPEDVSMRGMAMDSDEDDEEVAPPPKKVAKEEEECEDTRMGRRDREAALRKMMEESDEEDSAVATPDPDPEVEEQPEKEPEKEEEPIVTVSGGRRRGKRRVMKKRQFKDDEGYLVTKEEAVWESFSEDEPAPKPKPKPAASTSTTAKGKRGGEKKGQGNIMSFFGKKT